MPSAIDQMYDRAPRPDPMMLDSIITNMYIPPSAQRPMGSFNYAMMAYGSDPMRSGSTFVAGAPVTNADIQRDIRGMAGEAATPPNNNILPYQGRSSYPEGVRMAPDPRAQAYAAAMQQQGIEDPRAAAQWPELPPAPETWSQWLFGK